MVLTNASSAVDGEVAATLASLAAGYLQPWRFFGISRESIDEAHTQWADYRDRAWGGFVPLGEARNRLLRVTILGNRLYYVSCVGSKSTRRLVRQRAALRLLQDVLRRHQLPDIDLVMSISDRPTVPRSAVDTSGRSPPPVFAYVHTPWHYSLPFPYASFDPPRWAALHARLQSHLPLTNRDPAALWRGSCNSLCDMMQSTRRCRLPHDAELLSRPLLLQTAARCRHDVDAGITAAHRNCQAFALRKPVPIAEHTRHALLLHVDGNGFSGRLDELLTLGAAILKQDSPFSAYYYPLLQRGEHYESLGRNLSDLCHKAHALRIQLTARTGGSRAAAADTRAHRLAARATAFATRYLTPGAVAAYVATLLRQYAALLRFTPSLPPQARPWLQQQPLTPHAASPSAAVGVKSASSARGACAASAKPARCCARHPRVCS